MMHSKYMNVVIEPLMGYSDHISMARSYGVLRPGRGKIDVCLRNHSTKHTAAGEIAVIPALLAAKPTEDESAKNKATA